MARDDRSRVAGTGVRSANTLRAARAVVKATAQFTDRAMDAEALKRLDAALLPVIEGRR